MKNRNQYLTVRDLLAACSVPDMLARFPKAPWDGPFDVAAYQVFYDRLMSMCPVRTGVVVLGVWWRSGGDDGYVQPRRNFELSSWGLTAKEQKATIHKLKRDIHQSEKELAEGRSYTLDEFREELGIPKPTKREEARRHRQELIDRSTFARDLFGAMADYVRARKGDSDTDSIPARRER